MSNWPRRARVKALAKINLSLRVLHKRTDRYHELRTIFQTISLADDLEIEFTPARRTSIQFASQPEYPDNLALRAATVLMRAMRSPGTVSIRLRKHIPAGGGMGGGSSDAAAVLLALPVLAGRPLPLEKLTAIAADLGSDVPFFLLGGTALGVGRGTEVHPMPSAPAWQGLAVFPGVEIATAEAYRSLDTKLTSSPPLNTMRGFQALSWSLGRGLDLANWAELGENDFEPFARARYPRLSTILRELRRSGARVAMMSGSGSALFGVFADRQDRERARRELSGIQNVRFSLISGKRYRRMWWNTLAEHLRGETWPPRSRYAR